MWLDEDADWAQGPAGPLEAAVGGDYQAWAPARPTGGWASLEAGTAVQVPCTTDQLVAGYHGVSWWSTEVEVREASNVTLRFGGVRLLAEVFWDNELVGLDLEGYTPFEVAVPPTLATGGRHRVDVRVTNPGGAEGWEDVRPLWWGPLRLPSSHDFGGVWEPVTVTFWDDVRILDVWARPGRDLRSARVDVTVWTSGAARLTVRLLDPAGAEVGVRTLKVESHGRHTEALAFEVAEPDLYGPGNPARYSAAVTLTSANGADSHVTKFGFRLLDTENGQLIYNGDPFYLRSAISWSRYSDGPVPAQVELDNEVESLLALGQNALSGHRGPVVPALIDALEEKGLLLYQEPGGVPSLRDEGNAWLPGAETAAAAQLMEKRVRRLARRDRSRAALVWWNLANEVYDLDDGGPGGLGWHLLRAMRDEDDSRLTTFSSAWNETPMFRPYRQEAGRSFDYHTVNNWPAAWHRGVAENFLALRPPRPMLFLSGESINMDGLGWVVRQAEGLSTEKGETAAARDWLEAIDADLSALGPAEPLGGASDICKATSHHQGYSVARMIEVNRINPHIDGLAINAWHSHSTIGSMGLTAPDRRLALEPSQVCSANAPLTIAAVGARPVVVVGSSQTLTIMLIDDTRSCAGRASLEVQQRAGDTGAETVVARQVSLEPSPERVRAVAVVELPCRQEGLFSVEVVLHLENQALASQVTYRAVRPVNLTGVRIAVHDPGGLLERYFETSGAVVSPWRAFGDAPGLVAPTSLNPWPALLAGPPTRSVCIVENGPDWGGSRAGIGWAVQATEKAVPNWGDGLYLPVKGSWIGGWGVTVDARVLPTLAGTTVWDWTLGTLMPEQTFGGAFGKALTAALSFPRADGFSVVGTPRVLPSSVIVRRGGREVLVSTLPLASKADRDPLVGAVLADMVRWAAAGS